MNNWKPCTVLNDFELTDTLLIIDDALCMGFEFKVENHELYFREMDA